MKRKFFALRASGFSHHPKLKVKQKMIYTKFEKLMEKEEMEIAENKNPVFPCLFSLPTFKELLAMIKSARDRYREKIRKEEEEYKKL
jgi:hypothetical protein